MCLTWYSYGESRWRTPRPVPDPLLDLDYDPSAPNPMPNQPLKTNAKVVYWRSNGFFWTQRFNIRISKKKVERGLARCEHVFFAWQVERCLRYLVSQLFFWGPSIAICYLFSNFIYFFKILSSLPGQDNSGKTHQFSHPTGDWWLGFFLILLWDFFAKKNIGLHSIQKKSIFRVHFRFYKLGNCACWFYVFRCRVFLFTKRRNPESTPFAIAPPPPAPEEMPVFFYDGSFHPSKFSGVLFDLR